MKNYYAIVVFKVIAKLKNKSHTFPLFEHVYGFKVKNNNNKSNFYALLPYQKFWYTRYTHGIPAIT